MTTFAVLDEATGSILIEALLPHVAEWHMRPGRVLAMIDPDRSITRVKTMSSTFCIVNVTSGECTTTAPTPEMIERAYHARWAPPRGPEQVIAEFPAAYGVTINNFKQFPPNMVYDGVAMYAKRKAAT